MLPAKLHDTSERAPSLQPGGEALSCRSLFWERTVLSVLEKVQRLPSDVQGNVAARVGTYIDLARTASDDATLNGFIEAAAGERAKIIEQRAKPTVDRPWATAALAEAWCIARLGLLNGSLNRYNAMSVIAAIEAFASKRAPQSHKSRKMRLEAWAKRRFRTTRFGPLLLLVWRGGSTPAPRQ